MPPHHGHRLFPSRVTAVQLSGQVLSSWRRVFEASVWKQWRKNRIVRIEGPTSNISLEIVLTHRYVTVCRNIPKHAWIYLSLNMLAYTIYIHISYTFLSVLILCNSVGRFGWASPISTVAAKVNHWLHGEDLFPHKNAPCSMIVRGYLSIWGVIIRL